jgi:hypothetical protein
MMLGKMSVSSHPLQSVAAKSANTNGTFIESSFSPRFFTLASVLLPPSGAKKMKSCGVEA